MAGSVAAPSRGRNDRLRARPKCPGPVSLRRAHSSRMSPTRHGNPTLVSQALRSARGSACLRPSSNRVAFEATTFPGWCQASQSLVALHRTDDVTTRLDEIVCLPTHTSAYRANVDTAIGATIDAESQRFAAPGARCPAAATHVARTQPNRRSRRARPRRGTMATSRRAKRRRPARTGNLD